MKEKRNRVSGWILTIFSHIGIAGIACGISMLVGFGFSNTYFEDINAKSFEESEHFIYTYDVMWSNAARLAGLQEMLEEEGKFSSQQIIEIPLEYDDLKITLACSLEELNAWASKGIGIYDNRPFNEENLVEAAEETTGVAEEIPAEVPKLQEPIYLTMEEPFKPEGYESLGALLKEHHLNVEEINEIYDMAMARMVYINDSVEEYHMYRDMMSSSMTNFRYYIQNDQDRVYTNMENFSGDPEAFVKNLGKYLIWDSGKALTDTNLTSPGNPGAQIEMMKLNWPSYVQTGASGEEEIKNWVVMTGVDTTYPVTDYFTEEKSYFDRIVPLYPAGVFCLIAGTILYLVTFAVLTVQTGRRKEEEGISLRGIDLWKTETAMLFFGILAAGLLFLDYCCCFLTAKCFDSSMTRIGECMIIVSLAAVVSNAGLLWGWLSLVRRIKAGTLWNNSFLCQLIRFLGTCWTERAIAVRTGAAFAAAVVINLFGFASDEGFIMLLTLAADAGIGLILLIQAFQRQKIKDGIERIAAGELDRKIDTDKFYGDNLAFAEAVNAIGDGFANAVEESVKSERMKADLITNVSHDIKTPLTSIINYVDLMKRENIQDEKLRGYLEVLDAKSQRLKTLTEDLVEASKASSGNIHLEWMHVDFVELINQTNGEFAEKYEARNLQLITNLPKEPVYIKADGRRIWRVIENLYNNAAKYAMPGSRVYVELKADEKRVCFSMKNMSEQELNIQAEELTERFVRGDVSRSTDGSGLGLSIARNLTELQNGTFEIYLDGDLFRVNVGFARVWPENK